MVYQLLSSTGRPAQGTIQAPARPDDEPPNHPEAAPDTRLQRIKSVVYIYVYIYTPCMHIYIYNDPEVDRIRFRCAHGPTSI